MRLLLVFLLSLSCMGLSQADVLPSSDENPIKVVRYAIVVKLLEGSDARLEQNVPVDAAFVRQIAPKCLGYNITKSALKIEGADLKFRTLKDEEYHVGVWVFLYRSNKEALRNAKNIKGLPGNVFRTKILTPFSYVVVSNKMIVIFTETGGSKDVVAFVESAPALFDGHASRQ